MCWLVFPGVHISLRDGKIYANMKGFQGSVASFVPTECPVGGCRRMWKALEKGYLEHPGSACCTDNVFEISVRFGSACVACCLFLSTTTCHIFMVLGPVLQFFAWMAKKGGMEICAF